MSDMLAKHDYVWTFSGTKFTPDNIHAGLINIVDLANGLGREPRFGNQTDTDYSVAQHSIHIAQEVWKKCKEQHIDPSKSMLEALLHDAHEAYSGDMPKPFKMKLHDLQEFEAKINLAVFEAFGLDYTQISPFVKELDNKIVIDEALQLFSLVPPWARDFEHDRIGIEIVPWSKEVSSIVWLRMVCRLIGHKCKRTDAIRWLRLTGRVV